MTPELPLRLLEPVLSIPRDVYHEIHLRKPQNRQHCEVQFPGLCGQMPWYTMALCRYGKRYSGHVALYGPQLYVIFLGDR
jgi:hypothetical protein